ncbi:phenylalanine--tRNA ligase subunit beta [Allohahella marinimesophila]|uniref:Phenylalanine--tRNA ligase beta subunit n=1 Tax=Allohahella marinimesophila TaxID=1054972 RepID=A0ABP7NLW6_9GAMM
MKISEQWLRDWVDPALSTSALVHQITMAGLEVDAVETVAASFTDVVVGEITAMEKHPEADRLNVCTVSDGIGSHQVVCGAPNARVGTKVPFARIGASLKGAEGEPFKIRKAKLRGVESSGMLCSEAELQLSEAADGLMELPAAAPAGKPLEQYLKLDDSIIDIDLTPNRGDCLSVLGIAREVAAVNRIRIDENLLEKISAEVAAAHDETFPVKVMASADCPKFTSRIVRNVDLSQPTPVWMVERLRRSGIRSIDAAVDVTNYVMLELGQPMHAFDLDVLNGELQVRHAAAGETLTLLDETSIDLTDSSLVIADANGPLALAGIMGGLNSGVTSQTKNILFECAFFAPVPMAGRARHYGLHTDASHRFERGVDPDHQERAVHRATQLLIDICGGEPGPIDIQLDTATMPARPPVSVREQYVADLLGLQLSRDEIEQLLGLLDIRVEQVNKEGWRFNVPAHRFDVRREVDIIEEVARLYGYNKLPVTKPKAAIGFQPLPEKQRELGQIRQALLTMGFQEAITYSFVDGIKQAKLFPTLEGIDLANPIASDMGQMRVSLLPGLLQAMRYNQNRQQSRVRLFETGLRFIPVQQPAVNVVDTGARPPGRPADLAVSARIVQDKMLAGVLFGSPMPESRDAKARPVDFFDMKGNIEQLLAARTGHQDISYEPFDDDDGHYGAIFQQGQRCRIVRNSEETSKNQQSGGPEGKTIGYAGKLHPSALKNLDMNGPVFGFELRLSEVLATDLPQSRSISRYPEIRRDLAIIIEESISYQAVSELVRSAGGDYFQRQVLFDVYQGQNGEAAKGLELGMKSLGIGVVWQHPDRTLRDEEVQSAFNDIVSRLREQFGAVLRS